jgi:uncharacterized protein (UPF0335 family)
MTTENTNITELREGIERIERIEEERKDLGSDKRAEFVRLKSLGYDNAIVRQVIKLRAMDAGARSEAEARLDVYKAALGMD